MATKTASRQEARQERRPAYARITDTVRRSIVAGALPQGIVLLEGPLAEIFGSSRSPIKQALAQLETEGLVRRFAGRGMLVGDTETPLRIDLTEEHFLPEDEVHPGSQTAGDAVFYQVERDILARSLFGRFRVNELALARSLQITRAEARALLLRVQQSGIVEHEGSQWWTVPFDEKRLCDLYELRELVEPVALEKAAPHLPADVLKAIEARLLRAGELFPNLTIHELGELETDIHGTCLGFCPNRELVESLSRARASLISGKHIQSILMGAEGTDAFLDEHMVVVSALKAGEPARAAAALREHLVASRVKAVNRFGEYHRRFSVPDLDYVFD